MTSQEMIDSLLLFEAAGRMVANEGKKAYSESDVLSALGISEEDIANAEDVEIE